MKNLKKILALVLVMAVVFSFAAVSTSAAFTDAAEIARKEAVDVMAAIGVINGYTDGTFKPKGEVTRAEMAKMITVLLNKGDDVGDLYKGAVTFADSASHWAAGYIAYCAQEKIINGRNASTFDPNANVTGTEAAKMLLCALGYDPDVEGLTGASWASNTLSLAKKCEQKAKGAEPKHNLLSDMDSVSMTTPLSREDAAQMLLNAMTCTKVDYDGNAQTIEIGNTKFTTGATLNPLGTTILAEYEDLAGGKKLSTTDKADDFGRPAVVWTRGGEEIGSYSDAPVVTYKNNVQGGKVYTDLGKLSFEKDNKNATKTELDANGKSITVLDPNNKYELIVIVDGKNVTATNKYDDKLLTHECIVSGDNHDITPAGSWTEIYVNDDEETVTIVTAKYYIAKIANVVAATVDANGDVTREAYVTLTSLDIKNQPIPNASLKFTNSTENVTNGFITDAFTAADRNVTYVVYTKGMDAEQAKAEIQTLVKAEVKAGIAGGQALNVSTNKMTALTLDSTSYAVASEAVVGAFAPKFGTNATIYLDPNGNILYGEGTSADTYAFVLSAGQETDSIYGGVTTGANLLFTDGTTKKVSVYNENGNKYTDGEKGTAAAMANTVVSYYVDANGEYVLDAADEKIYNKEIAKVEANNPNLPDNGNAAPDMYANDNTVFVVETRTKDAQGAFTYTYTTYTGLKNVPTVTDAAPTKWDDDGKPTEYADLVIAGVSTAINPSNAAYVFVVGGQVKDTTTASVSVFMANTTTDSAAMDANNQKYYTTKAVVDGEIKTVKMIPTVYNKLKTTEMSAYNQMVVDTNGYVTNLNVVNEADFNKYVTSFTGFKQDDATKVYTGLYNNGIITMADEKATSYSVNASVPVFVFDAATNSLTSTTIDAFSTTQAFKEVKVVMDSAEMLLNTNPVVTAIYVSIA